MRISKSFLFVVIVSLMAPPALWATPDSGQRPKYVIVTDANGESGQHPYAQVVKELAKLRNPAAVLNLNANGLKDLFSKLQTLKPDYVAFLSNRSSRRFHQDVRVDMETLRRLVNLARLSASAGNWQPLKYILSCDLESNARIFPHTRWAGYLKDWPGPAEGGRPAAYIVILGDTDITKSFGCDHGIAAQSIMLGATEQGLGGCMIGALARDELRQALDIPARYEILLVLALGKPKETVVLEDVGRGGDIKYYRDEAGRHHVPKRALDELVLRGLG